MAIADLRPEVLHRAAGHYGIATTYTDYRELLDRHELDGVVVAVWHAAHYEVARAVLERGLHLLLEKPMVLRATHARELIRLAGRQDRQIIMSYPWQFIDLSVRVGEVVAGGSLGPIHYISDTFSSEPLYLYRGDGRRLPGARPRRRLQRPGALRRRPGPPADHPLGRAYVLPHRRALRR